MVGCSPHDGALGADPLGIVVAQRRELREVGDEHAAGVMIMTKGGAGSRRCRTGNRTRSGCRRVDHAADLPLVVAGGAARGVDGVAAVRHGDAAEFLHRLEGLVPRDAPARSFSPVLPARFMGYRMRSGWNSTCLKARQHRGQRGSVVRRPRT